MEFKTDSYEIYKGDCLDVMKLIPDKSIDMILCDLPYAQTKNQWDTIIAFDRLWQQYNRIIKDNGAIVLFARFKKDLEKPHMFVVFKQSDGTKNTRYFIKTEIRFIKRRLNCTPRKFRIIKK